MRKFDRYALARQREKAEEAAKRENARASTVTVASFDKDRKAIIRAEARAWLPRKGAKLAVTRLDGLDPTITHLASGMGLGAICATHGGFRPKRITTLLACIRAVEAATQGHPGWSILDGLKFGSALPSGGQMRDRMRDWARKASDACAEAIAASPEGRERRRQSAALGL